VCESVGVRVRARIKEKITRIAEVCLNMVAWRQEEKYENLPATLNMSIEPEGLSALPLASAPLQACMDIGL